MSPHEASAAQGAPDFIHTRFAALDAVLIALEHLWRPRPFREPTLPWQHTHGDLHTWLLGLDDAAVAAFENDHAALCTALACFVPELGGLPALCELPTFAAQETPDLPIGFEWGIDGRKWSQVVAFADALQANAQQNEPTGMHFVDWCSGKAHLSRYLSLRTGAPARALERNAVLVVMGQALAAKQHLPVTLHEQDVLAPSAESHLDEQTHAVALHACGRLHLRLMRMAAEVRVPRVSIAPCCHHLCAANEVALSQLALRSPLHFTPDDLHLAVQETVTSGASRQRQRETESAWRLGFDALQRALHDSDEYMNTPSAPRALLRTDFATFCRWLCERKGLRLDPAVGLDEFEHLGRTRHAQVTRLAMLRHAFRRPLEVRVLCDRAYYLEQSGYRVRLGVFCPRKVTPRNVLIDAVRA